MLLRSLLKKTLFKAITMLCTLKKRKMNLELGTDSNFLLLLKLGFLMLVTKPALIFLMKFASMRLPLSMVFVFLFIPLLESYSFV